MRATTLLRLALTIYHVFVTGHVLQHDGIVAMVSPQWRVPRCSVGGNMCHRVHDRRPRQWRHLDFFGWKVHLEHSIRRVKCRHCRKTTTKAVPWADLDSGFTRVFEERCAYYAKHADQSFVSRTLRITWRRVGRIVRSVVQRSLGPLESRLEGLRHIGIDELSYRKHHQRAATRP